jgi:hypothetical protein
MMILFFYVVGIKDGCFQTFVLKKNKTSGAKRREVLFKYELWAVELGRTGLRMTPCGLELLEVKAVLQYRWCRAYAVLPADSTFAMTFGSLTKSSLAKR